MPSRILALPLRQIDAPTRLNTRETGDFTLSPLTEDKFEVQYLLDFQGCKHFNTSDRDYQGYTLQEEPPTSSDEFDMPGLSSANGLRDYLSQILQPRQIVNEYGDECNWAQISLGHLTVLQARPWAEVFDACSPGSLTAYPPTRAQVVAADHVVKISQLLEEKHIFVVSDATLNVCQYQKDLQITALHPCTSQIVKLEPLVHWGTVTPATVSQSVFAFHRDGDLTRKPEYYQLVRSLVDTVAPAYCVDCLQYLWSKRSEARDTMSQLQSGVKRLDPCDSAESDGSHMYLKLDYTGITSGDKNAPTFCRSDRPAAYHTKPAVMKGVNFENVRETLPQLDGASSDFEELQFPQATSNSRMSDTIWIDLDSDETLEHIPLPTKSKCYKAVSTFPLRTTSIPSKSADGHSSLVPTTKQSPIPAKTNGISAKNESTTNDAQKDKNSPEIIDLITPPRTKERKFGCELNTNIKVSPGELQRSLREHKTGSSFLKENLFPAVYRMKPLQAPSKATPPTKETPKRKITSTFEQTAERNKLRKKMQEELVVTKFIAHEIMNDPPQVPELSSAFHPSSPVKLIVNFAKRPMKLTIPDGVATLTYQDFQNISPAPNAKICWCNKPANYSTRKKTDQPHISQCMNLNCRFRWYHYFCLNQSDKGKARYGNLFCQICRNEQEFVVRDKKDGQTVEKLINIKVPWTKNDIEAEMPGLGGHIPMVNPYGLGAEVDLGPTCRIETEVKAVGALGALDRLGYTKSCPLMLEEAYLHPIAYASFPQNEEGDEEWWYAKRAVDNDYSHGEETTHDEIEEEF
ncbi:hypothetical protein SVAN01_02731 [Stagonosporopsis vannaccii]|nr:hypothetical protein SVAN01_02731 [Stagonosporopsis vannaccii]